MNVMLFVMNMLWQKASSSRWRFMTHHRTTALALAGSSVLAQREAAPMQALQLLAG
jgi:hypothetical protein